MLHVQLDRTVSCIALNPSAGASAEEGHRASERLVGPGGTDAGKAYSLCLHSHDVGITGLSVGTVPGALKIVSAQTIGTAADRQVNAIVASVWLAYRLERHLQRRQSGM